MTPITEFRGPYFFLSNFYETPVKYDGLTYPSSEAAFQAAKCLDPKARKIFQTMTPKQAKQFGKRVSLRPDWEEVKLQVMADILKNKFENKELRAKLLATESANLVEGNYWHDTFWGVDLATGKGQNHLGELLMALRTNLKEQHT